ncbi:single-stranded DNA-binding protein [Curtobacterium sp. MCJR17_055]|uniref:single-stranded DNA-binding protein n=1 Tax=unclassified Curtobacterium TaxID=257496 RepID=UPI000D8293F4|nr:MULTISPECIES: single-stranded DNA-binding protein [unclassified Curtobacterium]PYY34516.1 single-stranded DNA-binding protein [Curtobacterium sp. MCBD17_029]PYY57667.1 single-stranded DNA-binding protein [Curtobacterium sp. MCPF17_015]PYY58326.1 single-stranded DNA-binding protein [Curtobacterium sp. MCJR17_055]PZE88171.1 single-stranded DNA-binding protein [Curtobacterium sp. MCBD17_008]
MNDTITVCGIIATEPRHLVTETGVAITSMRLASPSRRWDRRTSSWVNGPTNWYTVTAFRSLAANVHKSVKKGDRIVVTGRVRIRNWERDGRGGTSVEIDADALGHDLAWGISNWIRVPRHVGDVQTTTAPGPDVDPRTGEVGPDDPDADLHDDGPVAHATESVEHVRGHGDHGDDVLAGPLEDASYDAGAVGVHDTVARGDGPVSPDELFPGQEPG